MPAGARGLEAGTTEPRREAAEEAESGGPEEEEESALVLVLVLPSSLVAPREQARRSGEREARAREAQAPPPSRPRRLPRQRGGHGHGLLASHEVALIAPPSCRLVERVHELALEALALLDLARLLKKREGKRRRDKKGGQRK